MALISNSHTILRGLNGNAPVGDMFTSGLEYSGSVITGYSGSAIGASSQDYSAGANIDITDHVISVTGIPPIDVEAPLYIVSDTPTGKIIGFSGSLTSNINVINSTPNFVSGSYASGDLTLSGKDWESDIMGATANAAYVASGLAIEWVEQQGYLTAEQDLAYVSARVDANSADILDLSGKIKDYDVVGGANATVTTATALGSTTFTVNSKDWTNDITGASANAASVASAAATAWTDAQGYLTAVPTGSGSLTTVNNITPNLVSAGISGDTLNLSGRDWMNQITAASGAAVTSAKNYTDSRDYIGITPVLVNNTSRTIGVSAYDVSGIGINITKDDVHSAVIFSANSAGKEYTGISPVMVDNTADTIGVSAYEISGINIDITKDDVNSAIIFSAASAAPAFNVQVNGDTIDYSAASAMKMNVYNGGGRTAASAWGYLDSITLYPEGGSTSYGKTTFSLPDEYGFSGLLCRNGNQYKYIPYPFESAYHTSTSGLEMTGTDTKRTYFMAGPDTKFSIPVPKHTTIELHYQGMMDVGNINYDTIMGFEFTNSFSTADTGSSYIMATAEIILPTIREVANAASLGDTYNAYTSIDAPYYRRTYSTYMRYDNTSNYDQSLYMRVAPTIMGTQGWNTASWLKIGQPQPYDNIYYKLIPDLD